MFKNFVQITALFNFPIALGIIFPEVMSPKADTFVITVVLGAFLMFMGAALLWAVADIRTRAPIIVWGGLVRMMGFMERTDLETALEMLRSVVNPLEAESVIDGQIEFGWDTAGETQGIFTLQYGTDESFATPPTSVEVQGGSHRLDQALPAQTYFWRVRSGPGNSRGGLWSKTGSFLIVEKVAPVAEPSTETASTPASTPTTPPTTPPAEVQRSKVRFGAKLDGVYLPTGTVIYIDGSPNAIEIPNTLDLSVGAHHIKARYNEFVEEYTITVAADSETVHFVKFQTSE